MPEARAAPGDHLPRFPAFGSRVGCAYAGKGPLTVPVPQTAPPWCSQCLKRLAIPVPLLLPTQAVLITGLQTSEVPDSIKTSLLCNRELIYMNKQYITSENTNLCTLFQINKARYFQNPLMFFETQ